MSFHVDTMTKQITMHRGDTGSVVIRASGHTYGMDDRALFTVKDTNGTEIMKRVYEMTDNAFTVEFVNGDTDYLPPGTYYWDVRYIEDPDYDASDNIEDGETVRTPGSPYVLQLLSTVGQI